MMSVAKGTFKTPCVGYNMLKLLNESALSSNNFVQRMVRATVLISHDQLFYSWKLFKGSIQ